MPCWYYEKKELQQTPSLKDGISAETEARYRRDGARFIMDAGMKMGLRFDTCATGVVYFHRFYMFHSFKEFHRYVTAACCLFLAGKVEETPKKCKDLVKITRSMLPDAQYAVFGEDPKEEVMTLERILLQTIKFDLMMEHPYAFLLKYAKLIKGDKEKIQKMVQMAWTFINDSLCTTLCLQWEPEIIAVALMYLTSRLNKFEITDWQGKPIGFRGKWYEFLVEDVTLELLEDICHQVLDLYSKPAQKGAESPAVSQSLPQPNPEDQSRQTPKTPVSPHVAKRKPAASASQPMDTDVVQQTESPNLGGLCRATVTGVTPSGVSRAVTTPQGVHQKPGSNYSQTNPYMSSQMYSSSFMSQEGSQSIQSLIGVEGNSDYGQAAGIPYQQYGTGTVYQPQASAPAVYQQHSTGYQQSNVYQSQPSAVAFSQPYSYTTQYDTGVYAQASGYAHSSYQTSSAQTYGVVTSPTSTDPAAYQYVNLGSSAAAYGSGAVGAMSSHMQLPPPRQHQSSFQNQSKAAGGLPSVRITGRHSNWR